MDKQNTAEVGFQTVKKEIMQRGGKNVVDHKEGNKKFITFNGLDNKQYKVTSRSKKSGTWQTTITYGKPRTEKKNEDEFWLFIDIAYNPPKFYPVPLWWIQNNIHNAHQEYTNKYDGHRKNNDNSNHHAVQLRRIKKWENQWSIMGLTT
jgi:hypothetical protein